MSKYEWGKINAAGRREYRLHEGQSAVMQSDARFTAALAGKGGGKSSVGPLWMMKQIKRVVDTGRDLERFPFLGMVLAPTNSILNRATTRVFLNTFSGTALAGTHRRSDKPPTYVLPNGIGTIFFMSGYVSENVEGDQYDAAWVDEGGQLSLDTWIALQGRLGMRQAPALITTTLYHLHWIKKEVLKKFREGDPNYNVVSWSSPLNPEFPIEEYERMKKTLPPPLFGMYYDGIIPDTDALVFSSFDYDESRRECKYDPNQPILVGCNFAANPVCFVLAHRRPRGPIEVFDELVLPDADTAKALDMLHATYGDHRSTWIFYGDHIDPQGNRLASLSDYALILQDWRFGRRLVRVPENPIDIADRVAATNSSFLTPRGERGEGSGAGIDTAERRLFIDPKCGALITDLETRFKGEDWRNPVVGDKADGAGPISDALSLMVSQLQPVLRFNEGHVLFGGAK